MDRTALVEVFQQIIDGFDIPTPQSALRVKSEKANEKITPLPYSLATNLSHAVMWQDFWLDALRGGRKNSGMTEWATDWRAPDAAEWETLRERFISGFLDAARIAASEPFDHKMESDEEAVTRLIKIAVHGSYHIGQFNLIRRSLALRTTKKD